MHQRSLAKRAEVVHHLVEGAGVRATSRLTNVHKTTISTLLLKLGRGAVWLHNRLVRGLRIGRAELDEMHSFIHTREKNLRGGDPAEWGESWLWLGIASTAKLIISYRVAETRSEKDADGFVKDFRGRLAVICDVNSDGLESYPPSMKRWFGGLGGGINYGQVVKNFSGRRGKDYDRYAPPTKPMVTKRPVFGTPDMDACSTSFCERTNLSVRTCLRRFVRRGTGHSKSLPHHEAMIAIFVMWFNFARVHETLRVTPAIQAGLSEHVWSMEEFVAALLDAEHCEPPEPRPLEPLPEATKATERRTSTGVWLKAIDSGKALPKRHERSLRPGEQATIWTVLSEAKRKEEELSKAPPDEPPKPIA